LNLKRLLHTRPGREWIAGIGLFIVACLIASAACAVLVWLRLGHWVELLNGATWPAQFDPKEVDIWKSGTQATMFFLLLGFRTVLNLGIVLTAVFVFYLLSTGQLKEWFMSKLESVLNTRDTALAAFIVHRMKEKHVEVTQKMRDEVFGAADEFHTTEAGKRFLESFLAAASKPDQHGAHD
jgi:hypothetical protein